MNRIELIIKARSIYGQVRYYVDGDLNSPISVLTGQKTVTEPQIQALRDIGFNVTIIPTL